MARKNARLALSYKLHRSQVYLLTLINDTLTMADSRHQELSSNGLNLGLITVPNQILLQISTVPVLAALVAGKAVAETMQAIGQSSEEIFRGDRLPILPFPTEE